MKQCLLAKNAKQIDVILKSVHTFNVPFEVKIVEEKSGKLNYEVWVETNNDEEFNKLKDFTETMYS